MEFTYIHRDKLLWTYRLMDEEGNEELDTDDLIAIVVKLCEFSKKQVGLLHVYIGNRTRNIYIFNEEIFERAGGSLTKKKSKDETDSGSASASTSLVPSVSETPPSTPKTKNKDAIPLMSSRMSRKEKEHRKAEKKKKRAKEAEEEREREAAARAAEAAAGGKPINVFNSA